MPIAVYLSIEDRRSNPTCTMAMSRAVFGTPSDIEFMEEFVPPAIRVPAPKPEKFSRFLNCCPHVWEVHSSDSANHPVGFMMVCDMPHPNAMGFGIQRRYAGQGLMKRAFREVRASGVLTYPVNAYTSQRNTAAIHLFESIGFEKAEAYDEQGEPSLHFVLNDEGLE